MLTEREEWTIKRRKKGLTLTEISREIGISQPTLSRWELGKRNLKPHILQAYKDYITNKSME